MAQGLERLNFILSLVDQVSRPLRAVQGRLATLNDVADRSAKHVGLGFLAGTGAVLGLVGALKPAVEHARALREVASLGVEPEVLKRLSEAGKVYAARFGESATDFVRSAYDIQSAIAGLKGNELSRFTTAANITAKATKGSATEVSAFFGTMFGIFRKQADAMGRSRWVDTLAGQTATAVKIFKTTGPELSRAFQNLGADATTMGLSMAEQFAVLGQLQSTMKGSEAATRFRAFLRGVGQAQGELGVRLTDMKGQLLPLPDLLDRLRGRLGDIDTVAKSDRLKKAFGSDEAAAVVKLLIGDTAQLRRNITEVGKAGGLDAAAKMAETMVDPFQRLERILENLAITWGSLLLPLLQPTLDRFAALGNRLRALAERFPHLTRLIGVAAVSVFALAFAAGAAKVAFGLLGFALLPVRLGLLLLRGALSPAIWITSRTALLAWRGSLLAVQGAAAGSRMALLALHAALPTGRWLLSRAAMLAWRAGALAVQSVLAGARIGLVLLQAALPVSTWLVSAAAMAAWRTGVIVLQGVLAGARLALVLFTSALPVTRWLVFSAAMSLWRGGVLALQGVIGAARLGLMLMQGAIPVAVWLVSHAAMLLWRGGLLAVQSVLGGVRLAMLLLGAALPASAWLVSAAAMAVWRGGLLAVQGLLAGARGALLLFNAALPFGGWLLSRAAMLAWRAGLLAVQAAVVGARLAVTVLDAALSAGTWLASRAAMFLWRAGLQAIQGVLAGARVALLVFGSALPVARWMLSATGMRIWRAGLLAVHGMLAGARAAVLLLHSALPVGAWFVSRAAMLAWRTGLVAVQGTLGAARLGLAALGSAAPVAAWLVSGAAMLAWRGALLALQGVLAGARIAVLLFGAALWANPITWVVAGILALVAALAAAIVWWDELSSAIGSVATWFTNLPAWAQGLGLAFAPFLALPLAIVARWEPLKAWFGSLWEALQGGVQAALEGVLGAWEALKAWIAGFWDWLVGSIGRALAGLTGILDAVLGQGSLVGRLAGAFGLTIEPPRSQETAGALSARGEAAVIPGAAEAVRTLATTTDNSRRVTIGTVNVTTNRKLDGHELLRQLRLAADG